MLPNPVGYHRMYAHVDGELRWDKWWAVVRTIRVLVTNGPLLRPKTDDEFSGHVFKLNNSTNFTINGQLDSRDPIAAIELVQNGRAR